MRENRPYGSEGGKITNLPDPYQSESDGCSRAAAIAGFLWIMRMRA